MERRFKRALPIILVLVLLTIIGCSFKLDIDPSKLGRQKGTEEEPSK